ncbi:unnamed protein product [Protopolystoma xenopodis]|uniref:Uncharacterized protein n=1 Tax=Protopolystoma xenopodis TaxID=117903 RepID=A0A448WTP2_9PLAT|nr:unnamed protein product [Protopolystoma xenopodis]
MEGPEREKTSSVSFALSFSSAHLKAQANTGNSNPYPSTLSYQNFRAQKNEPSFFWSQVGVTPFCLEAEIRQGRRFSLHTEVVHGVTNGWRKDEAWLDVVTESEQEGEISSHFLLLSHATFRLGLVSSHLICPDQLTIREEPRPHSTPGWLIPASKGLDESEELDSRRQAKHILSQLSQQNHFFSLTDSKQALVSHRPCSMSDGIETDRRRRVSCPKDLLLNKIHRQNGEC